MLSYLSLFRSILTNNLPFSIFFLLFSIATMIKAQIYIASKNTNIPLYDHLHSSRKFTKFYNISDYFINIYILSLFYFNDHITTFLNLLSIIYLFRTFSFTITILPKCGIMPDKTDKSVGSILYKYLTLKDKHTGYNNDLLFSGHTAFMFLYFLYLSHFNYISVGSSYILFSVNFILSILNIISKCHYSIDILYGYIVTLFIFQNCVNYV